MTNDDVWRLLYNEAWAKLESPAPYNEQRANKEKMLRNAEVKAYIC